MKQNQKMESTYLLEYTKALNREGATHTFENIE